MSSSDSFAPASTIGFFSVVVVLMRCRHRPWAVLVAGSFSKHAEMYGMRSPLRVKCHKIQFHVLRTISRMLCKRKVLSTTTSSIHLLKLDISCSNEDNQFWSFSALAAPEHPAFQSAHPSPADNRTAAITYKTLQCKHQGFSSLSSTFRNKQQNNRRANTATSTPKHPPRSEWMKRKCKAKLNKDVRNNQRQTILLLEGARHRAYCGVNY